MESVYWAVRTESLYKTQKFRIWNVNKGWTYESNGIPSHLTEDQNSLDTKRYKDTGLSNLLLFSVTNKQFVTSNTASPTYCVFFFVWEVFCAGRDRIIGTFSRFCGTKYKWVLLAYINPLNPELNPICYLLALLACNFLHVRGIRVKSLTLRLLMSYIYIYIYIYIYGAPILDVSRSHTTTQRSR